MQSWIQSYHLNNVFKHDLVTHYYPALVLLNYSGRQMTYIVPVPCELFLKAAGINHNFPLCLLSSPAIIAQTYYRLLEFKLFICEQKYI